MSSWLGVGGRAVFMMAAGGAGSARSGGGAPRDEGGGSMSSVQLRDALVSWFVEEALPQVKRGMRFSAGKIDEREARRLARVRAHGFFQGLRSSYDRPEPRDLRQVKARMDLYLRDPGRPFPYESLLR